MADKEVRVTEVGNAYMVQFAVWATTGVEEGTLVDRGQPIAVLKEGPRVDEALGAAVRKALSTRIRTRKAKPEPAGAGA